MKLLLDEHISGAIAERLRERGRDVVSAREAALLQRPDPEVFACAAAAGRALVTQNVKDFRPLHAIHLSRGEAHLGLVLLSRRHSITQMGFGSLVRAIDGLLESHREDDALSSTECWL